LRAAAVSARGYRTRLRRFIEDFKYTLARRAPRLHKLIELMQSAQGIVEKRD
jgi:hypothetical protein